MNYTTYMIAKPIRIPLWELHRGELNPSLKILRNWVRFTGQDTSKGGGATRRAWRRHAYQKPRDIMGEILARQTEEWHRHFREMMLSSGEASTTTRPSLGSGEVRTAGLGVREVPRTQTTPRP